MTKAVEFQTMKAFDATILDECRKLDKMVYGEQFIKDIELETAWEVDWLALSLRTGLLLTREAANTVYRLRRCHVGINLRSLHSVPRPLHGGLERL